MFAFYILINFLYLIDIIIDVKFSPIDGKYKI